MKPIFTTTEKIERVANLEIKTQVDIYANDTSFPTTKATKQYVDNKTKVDSSYNPESTDALNGKAVSSALANYLPLDAELQLELDGGNAGAELDIEYVVDSAMSDTSSNPVENRVIKKYVDEIDKRVDEIDTKIIDYPVEKGTVGVWNYCKWNSGAVDLWGESIYTPTNTIDKGGEVRYDLPTPFALVGKIYAFIHPAVFAYKVRKTYQLDSSATAIKMFAKLEDNEGLNVGETISFIVNIKSRWK